jgi:AraC-like DNA-binding protein
MSVAAACLDAHRTQVALVHPQVLLHRAPPLRVGWRRLDDHLLVLQLRGVSALRSAGEELRLEPGDAAWVPAGVEHAWVQVDRRSHYRVRVRLAGSPPSPTRIVYRRNAWELQPIFALMQAETAAVGGPQPVRLRALLALLFSAFEQTAAPVPAEGLDAAQRTAVLARVAHWRTQRFPAIADLARAAGLGGDWFARRFHRTFGASPRAWLAAERLRLAQAELLGSDLPAAGIARRLGYAQYGQFARAFRAANGVSPDRYRVVRGLAPSAAAVAARGCSTTP